MNRNIRLVLIALMSLLPCSLMKRIFNLLCIATPLLLAAQVFAEGVPKVTHYSLKLRVFPKERRVSVDAQLTVRNTTGAPQPEIPLLLYRLLEIQSVTYETGRPLKFSQSVLGLSDEKNLQANVVKIQLATPLLPDKSLRLKVTYDGSIFGYPEVMAYVQDTISEPFSLVRPDAFAYPMVALPTSKSVAAAYDSSFTYDLETTVPSDYTVACGGVLTATTRQADMVTFVHNSKIPTWRIDIAAAKFKQLNDEAKKLAVYVLPEDEKNAPDILNGVSKAAALYSAMFGELKDYQGYTVIEIPDGWGSQASDYYLLETAAAFKDLKRMVEVYHEVAHSWNAKAKPEVRRTRWFDEAFAMYLQAIALREIEGEKAYQDEMDRDRESFIRRVKRDKRNFDTPIAEYGKYELGGNSYSKGAWSLYVLHHVVGEERFKQIIRTFLSEFRDKPADFKDFQQVVERVSRRDLRKYFNEWIYGVASSQLLLDKIPITEIVKRY